MSELTQLPTDWELQTIEDLAEPKGIAYGVLKPGPPSPSGIPMLRVSDVRDGRVDSSALYKISPELDSEYRRTKLKGGEVVVSIQGSVGRVAVVPPDLAGANVSRTLAIIRPKDSSLSPWLHRVLEGPSAQAAMRKVVGGTTRDSLNLRDLRRIQVPVPPAQVRSQVLRVIESSSSRLTSATAHVSAARLAVARFRQSALAAACSGRLTAGWRDSVLCQPVEPLLQRFVEQRRYRPRGKRAPSFEPAELPVLPDTWTWTDLDALAADRDHALKAGPFGSALKKSMYTSSGYRVYGQEQVIAGDADLETYFISEEKYKELASCAIAPGDILVSLVGTIGKVLVLPDQVRPGVINPRLIKVSLTGDLIDPDFVRLVLESPLTRAYYQRASQGSTMEILNLSILRGLSIPLPPLAEQTEILRRVERLMNFAAAITARLDAADRDAARSSRAILAKAFRGELKTGSQHD